MLVSVFPALALLFGAGIMFFYRLDNTQLKQIQQSLIAQRM
jgi:Na+/melibiose symporter-like transporter